MVNLSGVVSAGGLRPQQGQVDPLKNPTKGEAQEDSMSNNNIIDKSCVSDLPRPHRTGGRNAASERPAVGEAKTAGEESQEPHLVRSPSETKMVNAAATRFPFGASFTFWLRREVAVSGKVPDLEAMGTCHDVLNFWKYWNGIVVDRLPASALLAIFRHPDRPRAGPKAPGGKWVISPEAKEVASVFEELTLALVGGVFDEASEGAPCGVAFSKGENHIEVWNRCASDDSTAPVLAQLRELVGEEVSIEYHSHRVAAGTPTAASISPKSEKAAK